MTLEQTLETIAKIQEALDALAQSTSDAAEAFAKMWEEIFSAPDMWPGRKSVPHIPAQKASEPVRTLSVHPLHTTQSALSAALLLSGWVRFWPGSVLT